MYAKNWSKLSIEQETRVSELLLQERDVLSLLLFIKELESVNILHKKIPLLAYSLWAEDADMLSAMLSLDANPNALFSVESFLQTDEEKIAKRDVYITPLHQCVRLGFNIECVKVLLDNGADPNIPCEPTLNTPLHDYVNQGGTNLDFINLLVDHGADIHKKNMQGKTVLDCCESPDMLSKIPMLFQSV